MIVIWGDSISHHEEKVVKFSRSSFAFIAAAVVLLAAPISAQQAVDYEKTGFRDAGPQPYVLGEDLQTDRVMVMELV